MFKHTILKALVVQTNDVFHIAVWGDNVEINYQLYRLC